MKRLFLLLAFSIIYCTSFPQEKLVEWNFNTSASGEVLELVSGEMYQIKGFFDSVEGQDGKAIQFDGYTSYVERKPFGIDMPDSFTINVWVSIGAYPWFRCPIFDLRQGEKEGLLFAIRQDGRVCVGLGRPMDWIEFFGPQISLNTWTMLTLSVKQGGESTIYVNGNKAAEIDETPILRATNRNILSIGKNAIMEEWWDYQYIVKDHFSHLDGMIDNIEIFDGLLTDDKINALYNNALPLLKPDYQIRVLPSGPKEHPDFGADYTLLNYTKQWDRLWRVSDYPDVLLRFDKNNCRLVFWRGASFVPCWVTENGIWYTNEWAETWGSDVSSCAEPIMDRDCRFSHVRIIENTPARTVIHWRYGLVDADYKFAAIDFDRRGEWADEYFIIYPDGIGIRKIEIHYSNPQRNHDWEESIILLSPDQHPNEVISDPEVTLANMKGEKHDYSWKTNFPVEMKNPDKANIHVVNLKSEYKPFYIVSPEPFESVEGKYDSPFFRYYSASMGNYYRPDSVPSIYGWWNHWPVAQVPGDGRWVVTNDRASHFNLTTFTQWKNYSMDDRTKTRIMLHGMTNLDPTELVPLANSWLNSPELLLSDNTTVNYDQAERAYVIERSSKRSLKLSINASKDFPAVRPALIIKGKRLNEPKLYVNGKKLLINIEYRHGTVKTIDGWKTIIWIDKIFNSETKLRIGNS